MIGGTIVLVGRSVIVGPETAKGRVKVLLLDTWGISCLLPTHGPGTSVRKKVPSKLTDSPCCDLEKMGKRFLEISEKHRAFIEAQKMFFVGTATANSRVNVSPKGMDSLRVIDANRVVWLNVTGSGNETSAHVQEDSRMTIMFAAFDGNPVILRLYGLARVVHRNDGDWNELYSLFTPLPGARQIFDMQVDLVQSSCGMAVPLFDFVEERGQLNNWAEKKGEKGLREYWKEKNQISLDGIPTQIVSKNTRG